jgi:SRSO17 transposase
VDDGDFGRVARTFRAFHRAFAPLFGRKEARQRSGQYLRGLLVQQTDRRNAENLAEAVPGATPRALQRFLTAAPWDHAPVLAALQAYLADRLGPAGPGEGLAADGVWIVDDTGFAKQGTHSVGVARQYSGTLGKVGNCQIGVFLGYATARGHALVDARLYLPQAWHADPARCRRAGVPEDVLAAGYRSKADLALAQLRRARAVGALVGQWVTADAAFGQVPAFRDALAAEGYRYVVEVPCTTPVFTTPPRRRRVVLGAGRAPRVVELAPAAHTVQAVAAALPARRWTRRMVADGAQGPRTYAFAGLRVWESRDGAPGRPTWLLLRRNPDGSELKYLFSNAPHTTAPRVLARVSALRWPIETEFQQGKGEAGLDEYEVRSWRGWHHHVTLALLAGAFLLTLQQDWAERGGKDRGGRAPGRRRAAHPAPSQPGAARAPAPPPLDARRPAALAARHPRPQRPRHRRARQTPPAHAE